MKKKLLINCMLIPCSLLSFLSCRVKKDFSNPIGTLKTLQQSIYKREWQTASLCFSKQIRTKYEQYIYKKEFYYMNTGTIQSLFGPIPILPKNARFALLENTDEQAKVQILYPDRVDKDARIKKMNLIKDTANEWKINEVYSSFFK